jgi:CheY-like chemotaxis protein
MNQLPVLIVDDDLVDRLSLERWCKKHTVKYQIANNGLEALNLTKANNYSMVISDIDMPIMNGLGLVEAIRKIEKNTHLHLPVVAVSGNEQLSLSSDFKKYGFDFFLSKPARYEDLNKLFAKFLLQ